MTKEVLELDPATYKPFEPKTRQELLESFDKNVRAGRTAIEAATDEQLAVIWTLRSKAGQTIPSMPRSIVIRSVVMNHLIHHRAQLGVYLRLNEIEIPGMYGPSADEMKSWQAKSA
jgi:uncharacterized damage-inducible protein DinB